MFFVYLGEGLVPLCTKKSIFHTSKGTNSIQGNSHWSKKELPLIMNTILALFGKKDIYREYKAIR